MSEAQQIEPEQIDGATAPSERTKVRRGAGRAVYDDRNLAILDAGMVAHVGVVTPRGPIVLPMAYGRTDTDLFLHGATGNDLLRNAAGTDICVTVTLVDGLVLARSAFHNSMNYRSVVVRGEARVLEGDAAVEALAIITDHVVANWDTARPMTDSEFRRTSVLAVSLAEMSGKVRAGDPVDDPDDLGTDYWSGTVPLVQTWGEPITGGDVAAGIAVRPEIAALANQSTR